MSLLGALGIGAIASGLISGIGSAISGIIGSKTAANAQESANQTNIALAREQMAYQTSEREAVQEYNTPANQRARYEQAGINPYLALSGMNAGNTSFQTGVTPATVNPVVDNSLANMFQGLSEVPSNVMHSLYSVQQIMGNEEAIKAARTDNLYRGQQHLAALNKNKAEINHLLSQTSKNTAEYDNLVKQGESLSRQIELQEMDLKYQKDTFNARTRKERVMADLAYNQNIEQILKNRIMEVEAQYAKQFKEAELRQINSAISANYASALASKGSASLLNAQALTEDTLRSLRKYGVKLSQQQQEIANMYIGQQINTALDLQKRMIRKYDQDYENPFMYFGNALLGAGIGSIGKAVGNGAKAKAAASRNGYSAPSTSYGSPSGGFDQLGY